MGLFPCNNLSPKIHRVGTAVRVVFVPLCLGNLFNCHISIAKMVLLLSRYEYYCTICQVWFCNALVVSDLVMAVHKLLSVLNVKLL